MALRDGAPVGPQTALARTYVISRLRNSRPDDQSPKAMPVLVETAKASITQGGNAAVPDFGRFVVDYTEKWAPVIRAAGVKAE